MFHLSLHSQNVCYYFQWKQQLLTWYFSLELKPHHTWRQWVSELLILSRDMYFIYGFASRLQLNSSKSSSNRAHDDAHNLIGPSLNTTRFVLILKKVFRARNISIFSFYFILPLPLPVDLVFGFIIVVVYVVFVVVVAVALISNTFRYETREPR